MSKRPPWPQYFMEIAKLIATRSTCDRANVGCVLVKDNHQIAAGYNGSIIGQPHCDEIGHLLINNSCVRTAHAEANALINAARHGIEVAGCTAYITHFPCFSCFKLLANAGVVKAIYLTEKLNGMTREVFETIRACHESGLIRLERADGLDFSKLKPQYADDLLVGFENNHAK